MRTTLVAIFIVLTSALLCSQDNPVILYYPSEKNVKENIDVTVTRESDGFRYSYKISNSKDAEQSIWAIRILTIQEVAQLSTPEDWDVQFTAGNQGIRRVEWGATDSIFFINPGDTVSGFEFQSQGLPGLSNYYVQGWIELPSVDVDPDSIVGGGDVFERSKVGITLAPVAPPSPFIALAFLDTLISYKHQAFALGWIADNGIVTSLDQKLENARSQLQKGNNASARNILQAFINEVEALNKQGDQITGEVYSLLKLNAEYLLEKLE